MTKKHHHTSHKKTKAKTNTLDTQEDLIKIYLSKQNLTPEKIQEIMEIHNNICQKVNNNPMINKPNSGGQKWKMLKLEFSNMLSYGKNNVIDFQIYQPNQIFLCIQCISFSFRFLM